MSANVLAAQAIVIAKEPVPGRVKTRLTPPFTPAEAALLAEAALTDTLAAVAAAPVARRVLALEGSAGSWLPPGFDVIPQRGGGLDERLAAAFAEAHAALPQPMVLIGMDTPQVTPGLIADAAEMLDRGEADAVSGPLPTAGSGCSACAGPTGHCWPACRCRGRTPAVGNSTGSQRGACELP